MLNKQATQIKKPPVYKIFLVQMIATVFICLIFYIMSGSVAAYSSFIGGMIFTLPQLYFGIRAFFYTGARAIQNIVINFYKGESTKILIIAVSFALVFKFVQPVDYFALYSTFIGILVLNCFSALFYEK